MDKTVLVSRWWCFQALGTSSRHRESKDGPMNRMASEKLESLEDALGGQGVSR